MEAFDGLSKRMTITLHDLVVILYNMEVANNLLNIGFEDAENELKDVIMGLNQQVKVNRRLLESALWSSNCLDDQGLFWNPLNIQFKNFINEIARKNNMRYNIDYNLFEEYNGK